MVLDHLVIQRMDTSGRTVLGPGAATAAAKQMFGKVRAWHCGLTSSQFRQLRKVSGRSTKGPMLRIMAHTGLRVVRSAQQCLFALPSLLNMPVVMPSVLVVLPLFHECSSTVSTRA